VKRNRRLAIVLLAFAGFPLCWTYAGEKTYQTGKLVSIESPEVNFPLPLPSGQVFNMPVHWSYMFEVQQGDLVYVASCPKRDYKAEWRVSDDVEFRLKNDKMYLRRPQGKELTLDFILSARLDSDGKPITVVNFRSKKK
jgi:hypothetical protein